MDVSIEPECAHDQPLVDDIVRRAFADQPEVADLVRLVRTSPEYVPDLALVARRSGEPVGFVMLSGAVLVGSGGVRHQVLTLSPLAVVPEHQRLGIGSSLVRAGLAAADATGASLVALEGSPDYYRRLGFEYAPAHGVHIDLPDWAPPEAAQVYLLSAYHPGIRGRLVYPAAFTRFEEPA